MSVSNRLYKQSSRLPKYQPLSWKTWFLNIVGKDAVLWTALFLGAASSLAVRPPAETYLEAIDFRSLGCLAALMAASGGFMISGVFDLAAARLVNGCRSVRSLTASLVFATFFASMLITNDVALIVFVPMTLLAFRRAGLPPAMTVVLQTVAANVGSILLPMGNPQNLYLYSRYHMGLGDFFAAVLPLTMAGGVTLALLCLFGRGGDIACARAALPRVRRREAALYAGLFAVAALAVFGAADYRVAVACAVAAMATKGRNLVQQVDYALLLTFVGFFIFVGNISRVDWIAQALRDFVGLGTYWAAVLSSQVISNVPAAVLVSGFTDDAPALLAGVSAGGCGTLIASMASLISYKLYVRDGGARKGYLVLFTVVNVLFLAVMTCAYLVAR